MKTFFKKLEYQFLVETTKIENTSFSFKCALSEANVKTNSMATTKLTYHKEWSFASNYVSVLDSLKKSYFDVVFGSFFPGSILKCSTERNS